MKELPPVSTIQDIATEFGLEEAFIEKDWYAVEALKIIESIKGEFNPVFSGGTSLSKGFKLIQRFSEDLDFKIIPLVSNANSRGGRKKFKESLIETLSTNSNFKILEDTIVSENESKSVKFNIKYPKTYQSKRKLLPYLRIEITFHNALCLNQEKRQISSFVEQFTKNTDTFYIDCVSPIETAADKISALIWRAHTRDRSQRLGDKNNDPTIIRHLHDLCALKEISLCSQGFKKTLETAYENDKKRGNGAMKEISLSRALLSTCEKIQKDPLYKNEYEEFVNQMSYARDDEIISYETALSSLKDYAKSI